MRPRAIFAFRRLRGADWISNCSFRSSSLSTSLSSSSLSALRRSGTTQVGRLKQAALSRPKAAKTTTPTQIEPGSFFLTFLYTPTGGMWSATPLVFPRQDATPTTLKPCLLSCVLLVHPGISADTLGSTCSRYTWVNVQQIHLGQRAAMAGDGPFVAVPIVCPRTSDTYTLDRRQQGRDPTGVALASSASCFRRKSATFALCQPSNHQLRKR